MHKEITKEICDRYEYYQKLKNEKKNLKQQNIELTDSINHKGYSKGIVSLECLTSPNVKLIIETNNKFLQDFKFKIVDYNLMPKPCFRFDSDGATHINLGDNIPLSERQVKTPHFHEFKPNGIEFAYKTEILIKNEKILLSDLQFALAHFNFVENISTPKTPNIYREQEELFPKLDTPIDPLEGEKFDG